LQRFDIAAFMRQTALTSRSILLTGLALTLLLSTRDYLLAASLLLAAWIVPLIAWPRRYYVRYWFQIALVDLLFGGLLIVTVQTTVGQLGWLLIAWIIVEGRQFLRAKQSRQLMAIISVWTLVLIVPWQIKQYAQTAMFMQFLIVNAIGWTSVLLTINEEQTAEHMATYAQQTEELRSRVNELEQINHQMTEYTMDVQNRAVVDQLTGLFNQTYFHHRLLIEVEKARQTATPLSLLLCDIDYFKTFNDRFGHYLGDDVLRAVAHAMLIAVQDRFWIAGRIGGEEMVVLMPEVQEQEALAFAEQLRRTISDTMVNGPLGPLHVTISTGVASFPTHANDAQSLTRYADMAMYRAKDAGRNRVVSYGELITGGTKSLQEGALY